MIAFWLIVIGSSLIAVAGVILLCAVVFSKVADRRMRAMAREVEARHKGYLEQRHKLEPDRVAFQRWVQSGDAGIFPSLPADTRVASTRRAGNK